MMADAEAPYIAETGEIMGFEATSPYVETVRLPEPPGEPEMIYDEEGLPRINAQPVLWVRLDSHAGRMVKRLTDRLKATSGQAAP